MKIDTEKYFKPSPGLSIRGEEVTSPYSSYTNNMVISDDSDSDIIECFENGSPKLRHRESRSSLEYSKTYRSTILSKNNSTITKSSKLPLHDGKNKSYKKLKKIEKRQKLKPRSRYSLMASLKRLCCISN